MDTRLYVGNLSFDATEEDLNELFAQAGAVIEVVVMRDKFNGRSRGFAFVSMASPEESQKAIDMFNDQEFAGRKLQVNAARPKEDRPERSGSDRGGFRPRSSSFGGRGGRGGHSRGGHSGGRPSFRGSDRRRHSEE